MVCPIERKAKELFDRYKPGMKGKNTGLVYLLSIKDHKDRLTVGTGIGQTFNQSTCESIINSGHADYKKSYWNAGISKVLALYGPITILRQLFIIRRRHIHWQRSNRQLVTRKSGISNLVEKKTQDMETRIIEVKVRLIGQRNQHELHWRFS